MKRDFRPFAGNLVSYFEYADLICLDVFRMAANKTEEIPGFRHMISLKKHRLR